MHRKKVRQKAHSPGKRTPRYPVSSKSTGIQRRHAKVVRAASKASKMRRPANARGLYAKELVRSGENPNWEDSTYWSPIETVQSLYINPNRIMGDVIILKRHKYGYSLTRGK